MSINFGRLATRGFTNVVDTVSGEDAIQTQIYAELEEKLLDFGLESTHTGRALPRNTKSPTALIRFEEKVEFRNTNVATLSDYIIHVYVTTRHAQNLTGIIEKSRVTEIAELIRTWYNNKRDFSIDNLQLTKAEIVEVDTEDREDIGYSAKMVSTVAITFRLWEAVR